MRKQRVVGFFISDGCLRNPNKSKRDSGNFRFEATFKNASLDFVTWLKFDILGSVSSQTQPTLYPKNSPTQIWFSTRCSPELTSLSKHWYRSDGNKRTIILAHNLHHEFTARSVAFCIMGDGYWETCSQTVYICTENLTPSQIDRLRDVLFEKFDLVTTKKKENRVFESVLVVKNQISIS